MQTLAAMLMKTILIIPALILIVAFSVKANMDCIYTNSRSAITVRFTSPCFSEKYRHFIDSFVTQLAVKINRVDTSYRILVLLNLEHLYYGFSRSPDYFTSLGVDTLREMNSNFISEYRYGRYSSTEQSKSNPLDVNATNDKNASKEIGIKIVYNNNYRQETNWAEIEKLVSFSALEYNRIKSTQHVDTARHYSWYVTLPTIDTTALNIIMGRFQKQSNHTSDKKMVTEKSVPYRIIIISATCLILILAYKLKGKQSS